MGNVNDKESTQAWGIIPRALQNILSCMNESKCTQYQLHLSYMEIYNEEIYDLLPSKETKGKYVGAPREALELFESGQGQTYVRGLSKQRVDSVADGLELAERAAQLRSTSSNNINAGSSRSYCICQLELSVESYHSDAEKSVRLWITDLAGSERSKHTGVTHGNLRQKETNSNNNSLGTLKQYMSALRRNQSKSSASNFVSSRDSKLTRLFKNHLTGPSANRTIMIVNVNPSVADFDETQKVLSFATNACTIQITQDYVQCNKCGCTHVYNGQTLKRFKSIRGDLDMEPKSKTTQLASMQAQGKVEGATASQPSDSNDKELKQLKMSLSVAQAETKILHAKISQLEEQVSLQESQVQMELVRDMEEQMQVMQEQYNDMIDNLKSQ